MSENIAIRIEGISKQYRLGAIGGGTLKGDLQSWWARLRGKDDPNSVIGKNVYTKNERFWALRDVGFDVAKGEALGIIGHNGAGKSTLLKLISRVTAPTEGQIAFDGRIASMLEVGTGFHPELTGRENVYMNGAILGMTKAEISKKLDEIVEFAEMSQFIDTPVKRYSSGMYVKLAFSVAAHLDSEIMLMDEVLAVGDMRFQQKSLSKMSAAADQQGRTILYVSHNMNTIRQLCTRCVVLDHGKVAFNGDVERAIELYSDLNQVEEPRIDYNDIPRMRWLTAPRMKTMYAEYVGRSSINCNTNEPLELLIRWTNLLNVEAVCLRLEIYTLDNTAVGTAIIEPNYCGSKDEVGELTVKLDISSLAEGDYRTHYVFFNKNEYGTTHILDCVNGLRIKKTTAASGSLIVWSPINWGRVRLPDMELVELK